MTLPELSTLWKYDQPAETEARFRELLPQAETEAGPDYLAQLHSQLARSLGLQRKFDEALEWIESGTRICDEAGARGEDVSTARVRLALEAGRRLNSSQRQAEAIPHFHEALERAEAAGLGAYAIDALHMLGIADQGRQMEWNLKALSIAEASDDERARGWVGPLLNNLGWDFHGAERFEEALPYFERSLAWRMEKGHAKQTLIARWAIARCLRSLRRTEEALAMQQQLLPEWEAGGFGDDGYTPEEIGECLLALGRTEEAAPWFARAYSVLKDDTWLPHNEPERVARLKELGGVQDQAMSV